MAQFSPSNHCIGNLKVVIDGAESIDKHSLLEKIHQKFPPENRGKVTPITAGEDKTLFVELIPPQKYLDFCIRLKLFSLVGKVTFNSSRKLLLKGVDAIIFVVDLQIGLEENRNAFKKMQANAEELGIDLTKVAIVVLWNKSKGNETTKTMLKKDIQTYSFCDFEIDMQKDLEVFPWLIYLAKKWQSNRTTNDASKKLGHIPFRL